MLQETKAKRVLICEDQGITALAFHNILLRAGYEVVGEVSEGELAVALAKQMQPDFILMDIGLEGAVSGIEAACQILQEQNVAIIVVTAYSEDAIVDAALCAGACGFIVKPVSGEQLLAAIDAALIRYEHVQATLQTLEQRQGNKATRT